MSKIFLRFQDKFKIQLVLPNSMFSETIKQNINEIIDRADVDITVLVIYW